MRGKGWQLTSALVLGLWLMAGVQARADIPAAERAEVERRVEEMEAQFRRIRDHTIARCRAAWTKCTNVTCKKIPVAETSRWQTCQDACGKEYERCKAVAYDYWPEDDEHPVPVEIDDQSGSGASPDVSPGD